MSWSPPGAPVTATTTRSRVSHGCSMPWRLAVVVEGVVDPVGDPQQGQLAQRAEVAVAEVVGQGGVDLLGRVDVAVGHPPAQRLGGHVDELDLVGGPHEGVGDRLALGDAGDALDDVVEGLEVLDVDRRDDVDAGVEQLVDVLPALLVAASPGTLVWASSSTSATVGRAGEDGVEVHLLERRAPVLDRAAGDDLEVAELVGGVGPAVGLDEADDDVGAPLGPAPALVEHGEGLAHARGRTQVDAELSPGHGRVLRPRGRRGRG